MTSLQGKHRLSQAQTVSHGLALRASIWSADEDQQAVSGVGIIKVEISNLSAYPMVVRVEAKGEDVRWETQPHTNKQMSVLDYRDGSTSTQPFEVEANLSH